GSCLGAKGPRGWRDGGGASSTGSASPRPSCRRKRSARPLGKCNRNRTSSTSSPPRSKAKRATGRICAVYPRLRNSIFTQRLLISNTAATSFVHSADRFGGGTTRAPQQRCKPEHQLALCHRFRVS